MEVNNGKARLFVLGFVALSLGGAILVFKTGGEDEASVYHSALKFKESVEKSRGHGIVFEEDAQRRVKRKKQIPASQRTANNTERQPSSERSVKELFKRLDMPQRELVNSLDRIKEERAEIVERMREKGQTIPEMLEFDPEMLVALAALLDVAPSSLRPQDLERAELGSEEWFFVKTFAASRDFRVLLSQGALNHETVHPERLKMLYASSHHMLGE